MAGPRLAKTPKPLLNSNQLMEWLGISAITLERLIANDPRFPVEYIGNGERKMRRYDEDKVRAYMSRDANAPAA